MHVAYVLFVISQCRTIYAWSDKKLNKKAGKCSFISFLDYGITIQAFFFFHASLFAKYNGEI